MGDKIPPQIPNVSETPDLFSAVSASGADNMNMQNYLERFIKLLSKSPEEVEEEFNTKKMALFLNESTRRDIIENEAFMELRSVGNSVYSDTPPLSARSWRTPHNMSARSNRSMMVDCGVQKDQCDGANMDFMDAMTADIPRLALDDVHRDLRAPLAKRAAFPEGDLGDVGVSPRSRLGDHLHGIDVYNSCNEHTDRVRCRDSHGPKSYGTMECLDDDVTDASLHFNTRAVSGLFPACNAVVSDEIYSTTTYLYKNEMPVFKLVDGFVTDFTMNMDWEAERLLTGEMNITTWLKVMTRQSLFFMFALGVFFPSMVYIGLFFGMDLLVNVESSVTRRGVTNSVLLFAGAVTFCVFVPITAFFCRGGRRVRYGVLLSATTATVISGYCVVHGYLLGSLWLLLVSQLLHALGLAASVVAVLFINCTEMGSLLGTVSLMVTALHVWLMSGVAGLFIFHTTTRLASGGVKAALDVFFYITFAGPVFALAVCMLFPSSEIHRVLRTPRANNDVRKVLTTLRLIDMRFLLRCIACGCLLAVVLLLMMVESLFSSSSAKISTIPLLADLFLLTVLVVLPIFMLPLLGPFVRFCGFGPLTAVSAVSLFALISMSTPSASIATAANAIICGASLAVALAGLMRSLTAVRAQSSPSVVVPALLFATLLGFCVAFAAGITAVVLITRLNGKSAKSAALAGQVRSVYYVALSMCIGALCLQASTAAKTFRVRRRIDAVEYKAALVNVGGL